MNSCDSVTNGFRSIQTIFTYQGPKIGKTIEAAFLKKALDKSSSFFITKTNYVSAGSNGRFTIQESASHLILRSGWALDCRETNKKKDAHTSAIEQAERLDYSQ